MQCPLHQEHELKIEIDATHKSFQDITFTCPAGHKWFTRTRMDDLIPEYRKRPDEEWEDKWAAGLTHTEEGSLNYYFE
jgi:hypothetical protein